MVTMADNVEANAGSTKSMNAEEERPSDVKKVEELFAEGYKFFISETYNAAAEKLGEATELAVEVFGQFASQCFQPHYYYGRALVEIAREESLLVKAPQDDVEDEESEDNDAENGQDEADDNAQNNAEVEKANTDGAEEQQDETLNAEEVDNDEEVSTGSLAWESLEVARKICEKQGSTHDWLEKLCDVLVSLGDCMYVEERFEDALQEFKRALEIQQTIFEAHDRRIAETLFHIGRTCRSNYEFEQAAEFYEKAAETLQKALHFAIEKLKAQNADPESAEEVVDLRKVVQEVREQVQDARDSQEMFTACKEQLKCVKPSNLNVIYEGTLQTGNPQDTSDVQDITSLVRKKRPATDSIRNIETNVADNVKEDKLSSNGDNKMEQDAKKPKIGDNNENQCA